MEPLQDIKDLNPYTLCVTLLLGLFVVFLPRRFVIVPVLICMLYITLGQAVKIGTANFTMIRILLFFSWLRILIRREIFSITWNRLDSIVFIYVFVAVVTHTLLYQTGAEFKNHLGLAYDTIGAFVLFRVLFRSFDDIDLYQKVLALLIVPLAVFMFIEHFTHRNLFSVLGGVPEFSEIRDGKLRAQGTFSHPILAGTFGATCLPWFACLWFKHKKAVAILGLFSAAVITVTASSSGPLMACLFGGAGLCLWPLRRSMRLVRWGIVGTIAALALAMKAPVWYLFARISDITGGTGFYRSLLIEQTIRYFNEWWLIGTTYTAHWMPNALYLYPDHCDITNNYIKEGVQGGLLRMILFISIIVFCFKFIGAALRKIKRYPFNIQFTLWTMGTVLLMNNVSQMSVTYFDNVYIFYIGLIAIISGICGSIKSGRIPSEPSAMT
jgi:hypothetical protein